MFYSCSTKLGMLETNHSYLPETYVFDTAKLDLDRNILTKTCG